MGVNKEMSEYDKYELMRRRLVEELRKQGYIRSEKVYRAMLAVPREEFVPDPYKDLAYEDRPLPIGHGQTISAPSIVAYMIELLDPMPGDKVLEVGAGSGYAAAVLAEIVAPSADKGPKGHVYAIERIPELAEFARMNLERTGYSDRVAVVIGDGSRGLTEFAPFDRILVSASAPEIPEPLVKQLAVGGRMVIPVGSYWDQYLVVVEKGRDGVRIRRDLEVLFVPLVGEFGWK